MTDLLHEEITAVEGVWHLTVKRCLDPTPENIKAHIEAVKACKCPPMEAVFPESVRDR